MLEVGMLEILAELIDAFWNGLANGLVQAIEDAVFNFLDNLVGL